MTGWSNLTPKLRKHVVEKLDFMGRHSLRSTSKSDRSTVDSTELSIPRVRVSIKSIGYLIVIHSGIDNWLRMEIKKGPNEGTVIYKSQNSWNPDSIVAKELPTITTEQTFIQILISLFFHQSILIEAMEWEIEGGMNCAEKDQEANCRFTLQNTLLLIKSLRGHAHKDEIFRVKKLVTIWNNFPDQERLLKTICVASDFVSFERLSLNIAPHSLTPTNCMDTTLAKENMVSPHITSTINHWNMPGFTQLFAFLSTQVDGFGTLRFVEIDSEAREFWDTDRVPEIKMDGHKDLRMKKTIEMTDDGPILFMHLRTSCGYWMHAVLKAKREILEEYFTPWMEKSFETGICGLGWLCPKHSTPFDYHYHQNLGRRVHREPDWCDVTELVNPVPQQIRLVEGAKKAYAEDEKKVGTDGTEMDKSWGFRDTTLKKLDSDDLDPKDYKDHEDYNNHKDLRTSRFYKETDFGSDPVLQKAGHFIRKLDEAMAKGSKKEESELMSDFYKLMLEEPENAKKILSFARAGEYKEEEEDSEDDDDSEGSEDPEVVLDKSKDFTLDPKYDSDPVLQKTDWYIRKINAAKAEGSKDEEEELFDEFREMWDEYPDDSDRIWDFMADNMKLDDSDDSDDETSDDEDEEADDWDGPKVVELTDSEEEKEGPKVVELTDSEEEWNGPKVVELSDSEDEVDSGAKEEPVGPKEAEAVLELDMSSGGVKVEQDAVSSSLVEEDKVEEKESKKDGGAVAEPVVPKVPEQGVGSVTKLESVGKVEEEVDPMDLHKSGGVTKDQEVLAQPMDATVSESDTNPFMDFLYGQLKLAASATLLASIFVFIYLIFLKSSRSSIVVNEL